MVDKSGALARALAALRAQQRISQKTLARESGVSEGTVRDIETGITVSKPVTLRRLAVVLARDPLVSDVSDERVEDVYQRLMRAAGYIEDRAAPQPTAEHREPIEAEIARLLRQIPGASIALTSLARGIHDADEEDREFVVEQLRLLAKRYGQPQAAG